MMMMMMYFLYVLQVTIEWSAHPSQVTLEWSAHPSQVTLEWSAHPSQVTIEWSAHPSQLPIWLHLNYPALSYAPSWFMVRTLSAVGFSLMFLIS